jgi:hypothetical protein
MSAVPLALSPISWLASAVGADRAATERDWPRQPGGIQMLPCGVYWDVVRLPEELGLAALRTLLAADATRPAVGPVMHDPHGGHVYWLVSMERHADYTWSRVAPESRVRSSGDYLAAVEPEPAVPGPVRWVHWPAVTSMLTPPALLAAAVKRELNSSSS